MTRDDFRPEFLEEMQGLMKLIYSEVVPKKINAVSIDGAMLVDIATNYVKSMNEGGVPVIQSSWEFVISQKCRQLIASCEKLYLQQYGEKDVVVDESQMFHLHEMAKANALQVFRASGLGEYGVPYEEKLSVRLKIHIEYVLNIFIYRS